MYSIKSLLILAPHLQYPLENGADILLGNRINGFLKQFEKVTIVGNGFVSYYSKSKIVKMVEYKNKIPSKIISGVNTIVFNKSYLYNKFITSCFLKRVQKADIINKYYDVVYYSFTHTADGCSSFFKKVKLQIIETHNDDIVWYSNLYKNSNNIISKFIAYKSIIYTKNFLRRNNNKFFYIALNDNDKAGYLDYIDDMNIWVVSAGISMPLKNSGFKRSCNNELVLIFVGSLDVKMNYDALYYFSRVFYRDIINSMQVKVTVNIVGRNPSDKIKKLCIKHNWSLFPDVGDFELSELLYGADFMILPFSYTTGTKMKLLEAFAHNLPILSTKIIQKQIDLLKYQDYNFGLFSDNASEWISCINDHQKSNNLKDIAEEYSCENVNKVLFQKIINEIS